MKCVSNGKVVVRVPDDEAEKLVDQQGWSYVPKKFWKASREVTIGGNQ